MDGNRRSRFLRAGMAFAALFLLAAGTSGAQWSVSAAVGLVYNAPVPLTIRQEGFPPLRLTARYDTHPFRTPLYYVLRVSRWDRGRSNGWELTLVHQKLYLSNPPSEVGAFSVSHGCNLVTLNRAWRREDVVLRFGAGPVIAHPESIVRGKKLSEDGGILGRGYYLSGACAVGSVARRFTGGDFFLDLEGMLAGAYADVPVGDGSARAPNLSLHGIIGAGYQW
jgi:hypothetical protein